MNSTRINVQTENVDHLSYVAESRKDFQKYCHNTISEGPETWIFFLAMLDAMLAESIDSYQYITDSKDMCERSVGGTI